MTEFASPAVDNGESSFREGNWVLRAGLKARRFRREPPGGTVVIGDSIAAQWPANVQLAPTGGRPPANLGIGGDRIRDVRWRLLAHPLSDQPPGKVILIVGTNDLPHEAPQDILGGMAELIRLIRRQAPECHLVVVGLLPRGPTLGFRATEIARVNASLSKLESELGFAFVCLNEDILSDGGVAGSHRFYLDRSHLNETGYDLLARRIGERL